MRTFSAVVVGSLILVSSIGVACTGAGDPTRNGGAGNGEVVSASVADWRGEQGGDDKERHSRKAGSESSPFIVGEWKFIGSDGGTPSVDTEFRFANPTNLTVNLEYAFFELDGTFCGCDRDVLDPNKTVVYTVFGESMIASPVPNQDVPFQFSCKGTSGALKSIVFVNSNDDVVLGDATQVGFQTHAFGGIQEFGPSPNFNFLTGNVMTESGMKGIALSDSTRDEIRLLHQNCVSVQGPLGP